MGPCLVHLLASFFNPVASLSYSLTESYAGMSMKTQVCTRHSGTRCDCIDHIHVARGALAVMTRDFNF